jgi:septal ring factor EnvC (AmiA/AmiB activator)
MKRALSLSFLAAALLASAAGVDAQSPEQQRESDLSKIRARIAALQGRLTESEKHAADLTEEIKRLDWKLEIAQQESKLLAARREELTRSLASTHAERESASAAASLSAKALVARARVLHRFGRFGYFRILLEARDASTLLQGLERLDSLARRDGRLLAARRAAERRLADDIAREEAIRTEIDQNWTRSRRDLLATSTLRRTRESLLTQERRSAISGREEVHALSDKAARLERLLETLARQSSSEMPDSSGGIRRWKGVLDWPAKGSVVETFGRHRHPKFDAWTVSNGVSLATGAGAPVRAVYAGKVVYAQWLAEYGNLVIVDHGDGVFTLYAWLQSVGVSPGTILSAGAPVGTAGTGPGRDEPGVYFEVRDRQKASDPVAWLR